MGIWALQRVLAGLGRVGLAILWVYHIRIELIGSGDLDFRAYLESQGT